MNIGFIGIGVMGGAIVNHLLENNYTVIGHTRTKSKAKNQISSGMIWSDTIADVVQKSDLIFTMVGFPTDVETIYLGTNGILAHVREGQILIDLTTSTPTLAKEIAMQAATKEAYALDAPVTGGDIGAINGSLSMMIGGDQNVYNEISPLLSLFTATRTYFGAAGNGQHMKMANQIAIAANLIGMAESLAYAKAARLNATDALATLNSGSAASWQIRNNGPKTLARDVQPGFYIKHFLKDLRIALDEMYKFNIHLPNLILAESLFTQLDEEGNGDLGTQAIYQLYDNETP